MNTQQQQQWKSALSVNDRSQLIASVLTLLPAYTDTDFALLMEVEKSTFLSAASPDDYVRQILQWIESRGITLPPSDTRALFPFFYPQQQQQQPPPSPSQTASSSYTLLHSATPSQALPNIPTSNLAARYFATAQAYPQYMAGAPATLPPPALAPVVSARDTLMSSEEVGVIHQMQHLGLQSPLLQSDISSLPGSPRIIVASSPRISVLKQSSPATIMAAPGPTTASSMRAPLPFYTPHIGSTAAMGGSGVDPLYDVSVYAAAASGRSNRPVPRSAPTSLAHDGGFLGMMPSNTPTHSDLLAMPDGRHHKHHGATSPSTTLTATGGTKKRSSSRNHSTRSGSQSPISVVSSTPNNGMMMAGLPQMPNGATAVTVTSLSSSSPVSMHMDVSSTQQQQQQQLPSMMDIYQFNNNQQQQQRTTNVGLTPVGSLHPQPSRPLL